MLDSLTAIWCRAKRLSRVIIDASPNAPRANTFKAHFGGLTCAYRRVGYQSPLVASREYSRNLRKLLCDLICEGITQVGGTARALSKSCQLRLNEELTVTVVLGRSAPSSRSLGQNQWRFGYRSHKKPDFLIVARVDEGSEAPRDYFVLPFGFLPHGAWVTTSGVNYKRLEGFRADTLASFYALCARNQIRTVCDD